MRRLPFLLAFVLTAASAVAQQSPHDSVQGAVRVVDVRGRTIEVTTGVGMALRVVRLAAVGLAALALVACRKPPAPGEPLAGLSAAERARFDSGKVVFDSVFTAEKGLGPLFNSTACAECHEDPVAGGTGDEVERHATAFHPDATGRACDELAGLGGPVFENHVTPAL